MKDRTTRVVYSGPFSLVVSPMAPLTSVDPADNESRETATWTRYLPEAFGIREAVRKSPYRWCTRER